MVLGDAEGGQVLHHGSQFLQALVKDLVPATIALQGGQDGGVVPGDGDEVQNLPGSLLRHPLL